MPHESETVYNYYHAEKYEIIVIREFYFFKKTTEYPKIRVNH